MIEDNNNYYCKACFKHEDSIDLPDHLKSSKVGNTGVFSKTQEKLGYIKRAIRSQYIFLKYPFLNFFLSYVYLYLIFSYMFCILCN